MKLALPLPGNELSPNARPHYMAKAKATKELRQSTALEAMCWCKENANTFPWPEATIQLTFYFARNGRRDPDNLLASAKAAFDGLRDAGVLMDDDKITHLPVEWKKDKDDPRLELELYPHPGDEIMRLKDKILLAHEHLMLHQSTAAVLALEDE